MSDLSSLSEHAHTCNAVHSSHVSCRCTPHYCHYTVLYTCHGTYARIVHVTKTTIRFNTDSMTANHRVCTSVNESCPITVYILPYHPWALRLAELRNRTHIGRGGQKRNSCPRWTMITIYPEELS